MLVDLILQTIALENATQSGSNLQSAFNHKIQHSSTTFISEPERFNILQTAGRRDFDIEKSNLIPRHMIFAQRQEGLYYSQLHSLGQMLQQLAPPMQGPRVVVPLR